MAEIFMDEETQKGRYLTFQVDEEVYGIEILYVSEIVKLHPITVMPEMPDYVKGIINLRGKIVPVIDMRILFHIPTAAYTERTCIVVLNMQGNAAGLIVDRVDEVLRIPDESISSAPDYQTGMKGRLVKGVGNTNSGVKLLLDLHGFIEEGGIEE